jgi:hypothetical protein
MKYSQMIASGKNTSIISRDQVTTPYNENCGEASSRPISTAMRGSAGPAMVGQLVIICKPTRRNQGNKTEKEPRTFWSCFRSIGKRESN